MRSRFDVFLRCACGHEGHVELVEHPGAEARFRCATCGQTDPEIAVWPIWQRPMRRDGWSPW